MRLASMILFSMAAVVLLIGSVLAGSPVLATACAVVDAGFGVIVYVFRRALLLDLGLAAFCVLAASSIFVNVNSLFAVSAVVLALFAWNGVRQFGHFDDAPVSDEAKKLHAIRYGGLSFIPAAAVTALIALALQIQIQMSFGYAVLLVLIVFALIGLFVVLTGRKPQRGDTTEYIDD